MALEACDGGESPDQLYYQGDETMKRDRNRNPSNRKFRLPVATMGAVALASLGLTMPAASAAEAPSATVRVSCGNVYGPNGLVPDIRAANTSGAPTTISLANNCVYTLNVAQPALGGTGDADGLPPITGILTILGNGTPSVGPAIITRSLSGPALRIAEVGPTGTLHLVHIGITRGESSVGGGIYNNGGRLLLDGASVIQNIALAGDGGGLLNNGIASISGATQISGNSSLAADPGRGAFGGGIENNATLRMIGGAVSTNAAHAFNGTRGQAEGGGISNFGTMSLSRTTVDNNTVESDVVAGFGAGGGIQSDPFKAPSSTTLIQVDISGNSVVAPLGGTVRGGGVIVEAGLLIVGGGIITRNTASPAGGTSAHGGGIYVTSGTVTSHGAQVVNNTPDNCEPSGVVAGCTR